MTTASQKETSSKSARAAKSFPAAAGGSPPKKKMDARAAAPSPASSAAKIVSVFETDAPVSSESCSGAAGGLLTSIATAGLKLIKVRSPAKRSKSCDSDKGRRRKNKYDDRERRKARDENAENFGSSSSNNSSNSKQQQQQQQQKASASRTTSSDSGSSSVGADSPPSEETVSKNIRHYINMTKHMDPNVMLSHMSFQDSSFIRECLHWHNYFRTRHQVPDLVLSPQLCASAQEWANLLANTNTFRYRNQRDVGENLFCRPLLQSLGEVTGKEVAIFWYSNIRKYDFTKKPDLLHIRAGSFSQMVWSGSKFFGIAKARSKQNQKIFIVAHYYPPGNVAGRFHDNVLIPLHSGGGGGGGSAGHHSIHQFQLASGRKKSKDPDSSARGGGGSGGERRSNASDETNVTSKSRQQQEQHSKRRSTSEHDGSFAGSSNRGHRQRAADLEEEELLQRQRLYLKDGEGGIAEQKGTTDRGTPSSTAVTSGYNVWPNRRRGASLSSQGSSHSS